MSDRPEGGTTVPFYDYSCEDCGSTFEVKRRMSEQGDGSSAPTCSCCGSGETRRVFGAFSSGSSGDGGGTASGPT